MTPAALHAGDKASMPSLTLQFAAHGAQSRQLLLPYHIRRHGQIGLPEATEELASPRFRRYKSARNQRRHHPNGCQSLQDLDVRERRNDPAMTIYVRAVM